MIQAFGLTSNPRKAHPPAVDDVSFEARAGRVTTLLGAAGAGKTTVLRLVLELRQGRGITYFRGRPLHRIAHPSREVGVLLGDVPGHPARSVRGHLRMLCAAAGVPARRADEVLEVVGLVSLREERLGSLSRGMDRRLGLACALLPDPHTLVLDEPTVGLSAREARWLHGMLRAHASQGGTVLFTTADSKEAARTADRVVTLDGGTVVADQEAREFARTRLRPRVAVRSPYATRLAALLVKEARTARCSVEVVREDGNRLSVYGSTTADIGEIAFRNGILVHQLADEVGDMGPSSGGGPEGVAVVAVPERDVSEASSARAALVGSDSGWGEGGAGGARAVSDLPARERRRRTPGFPLVEQKQVTAGAVRAGQGPDAAGGGRMSVGEPRRHPSPTDRAETAQGAPAQGAATAASGGERATPSAAATDSHGAVADVAASSVAEAPDTAGALPTAALASAERPHSAEAAPETVLPAAVPEPGLPAVDVPEAQADSTDAADGISVTGPRDTGTTLPEGSAAGRPAAEAALPVTPAAGTPLPGARTPDVSSRTAGSPSRPPEGRGLDISSPLPPPISVRSAPSPLRPLRYELRRATGIGTGFLTCGAVLVVSALTALFLARLGHTPQVRLFAAWPRELPLPPAALASGLLGALAFGDEFRHPALAADRGTVPRRLGLLTAKLLVAGATALMLAFLTLGCDAEALYLVYGRELAQVPADWLSLSAGWFGLVVGCAWAGVLAAGVFRSTTAGLAAVLAVPVVVVPLVHRAFEGRVVRVTAGLLVRSREVLLLQWPFGGERYLLAAARVVAQPVGGALTLSLAVLLCAYVFTALRTRAR